LARLFRLILLPALVVFVMGLALGSARLADWASQSMAGPFDPIAARARSQSAPLRVGLQVHPAVYFIDPANRSAGLEYDLVEAFARTQRMELKVSAFTSMEEAQAALARGEIDLLGGALTTSRLVPGTLATSARYFTTPLILVHSPRKLKPNGFGELLPRRVVVSARLQGHPELDTLKRNYPGTEFVLDPASDDEALLASIEEDQVPYALVERATFEATRHFHSDVGVAFTASAPLARAWVFRAEAKGLKELADHFLHRLFAQGLIERVLDRYFGFPGQVKPADLDIFTERVATLLPKFRHWFHEAQERTGIEWRLLAALAYQESHWNADAVSPTGVQGFMQLTEDTARRLGVTDRRDPKASILGGAQYLAMIKRDQIPARIPEPERTFLALAAYNIGPGHLENARIVTKRLGRNPDVWVDVRRGLTQLARPDVAGQFPLGPCRCLMPIELVESVRAYYDVLLRLEAPHEPRLRLVSPR